MEVASTPKVHHRPSYQRVQQQLLMIERPSRNPLQSIGSRPPIVRQPAR